MAPALGGASRVVIPSAANASVIAATWSPDGSQIAFVRADSLMTIPVDGGSTKLIAVIADVYSCNWSSSGRWMACATRNPIGEVPGSRLGNLAPSGIIIVPATGGAPITIAEPTVANASPVWFPGSDRLLFVSNRDGPRDVYAVDISASGRPRAPAARLTTGLGAMSIALSGDGRRLAYAVYTARANLWSLPIPRTGTAASANAGALTVGRQSIESVRVSPDGRWLLFDSDRRGPSHAWRIPVAGGDPEQLTDGPADEFAPDLSPDGRGVVYHSWRTGTRNIEIKTLTGADVVHVTANANQSGYPVWSPDGQHLAFFDIDALRGYVTSRSGGGWSSPRLIDSSMAFPEWSPDGRWLSYIRVISAGPLTLGQAFDRRVSERVVVRPAAGGPERTVYQSPSEGPMAEALRWAPDSRTLYFKAHDATGRALFWALPLAGGAPHLVARIDDLTHPSGRGDFAVDGAHFYFPVQDRTSDVFVADVISR
jgi:Tol biopolymer transport system component